MEEIINSHKFKKDFIDIVNSIIFIVSIIVIVLVPFIAENLYDLTLIPMFLIVCCIGLKNYKETKCSKCGLDKDDTIHKYIIPNKIKLWKK
jgi:hypothetical protein